MSDSWRRLLLLSLKLRLKRQWPERDQSITGSSEMRCYRSFQTLEHTTQISAQFLEASDTIRVIRNRRRLLNSITFTPIYYPPFRSFFVVSMMPDRCLIVFFFDGPHRWLKFLTPLLIAAGDFRVFLHMPTPLGPGPIHPYITLFHFFFRA